MVMPETGLADVPMRPQMREDTVTNRKPKITTRIEATRLCEHAEVGAPARGRR